VTRRIATIARALAANLNPAERGVHYHGAPQGAFACTDARCTTPRGGGGRA
jgi:hypothetical protein